MHKPPHHTDVCISINMDGHVDIDIQQELNHTMRTKAARP